MPEQFLPFLPAETDVTDGQPFYYTAQNSTNQNDVLNTHQGAFDIWASGVIPRPQNALEVSAGVGLSVNLSEGLAFVRHSQHGPFFLRQSATGNLGPLAPNRGVGNEIFLILAAHRADFHDSARDGIGQLVFHDNASYDGGIHLATITTSASGVTSVVPNPARFTENILDIHGLTAKSSVVGADELVIWDSLSKQLRKITVATLLMNAGGGGGGTVTQLSQLTYNNEHPVQADAYIDSRFNELRGELDELLGGAKKFPEQSDLVLDLTAALAVGLFEVNPPAILRAQMSALGRGFGKGQNSTPDFSPTTGAAKEAAYDAVTGLIRP